MTLRKRLVPVIALFMITSLFELYAQQDQHRIYLIGDAGLTAVGNNGLRELLQQNYDNKVPSTVIFLGDNIYEKGMPRRGEQDREESEAIMRAQIDLVNGLGATVIFVPGNHDWKKGKPGGFIRVREQEQFIDSLSSPDIKFFPQGGCPGPVEISLSQHAVLILFDSQWFLHPWTKPVGDESPCEAKSAEEAMILLLDILERNKNKQCIVAAHHPIFTYGEHGGVFPLGAHIFPLRDLNPKLYIPFPVIGSIYPMYRKFFGDIQDIRHPINRQYRDAIRNTLGKYPGTIYVSGHEHALEYAVENDVHYIVSGAGVKNTFVKKKSLAQFASANNGFVRVDISCAETAIQFFEVNHVKESFSREIKKNKPAFISPEAEKKEISTVNANASDRYEASRFKRWLLGDNYRAEWQQLIEVPVFDITKMQGGLTPRQKGGGMQTLSLRLTDSVNNEYTFRSVEKFPEKAVPEMLRGTFGADLVQDQISAAHPYGALVIPPLAEAAHIYHASPQLGVVADNAKLAIYRKEFANTMVLFEERPADAAKEKPYFGYADKIISTEKVLQKLRQENDARVDQTFVVRSRLFDLIIGDWDRHDDQWRWAVTKGKKSSTYRPIPRDRDQAFFVSDGVLSELYSRRWALPKLEGFHDKVRWAPGFMYNARYFDRSFLNALDYSTWEKESKHLQQWLTDEVIESSVKKLPASIETLHGDAIVRKLKGRRNDLQRYSFSYYRFLAREVDIPGSDKREKFIINVHADHSLDVLVTKITKKGNSTDSIYYRKFKPEDTKEIRLFGLGGDDVFLFAGEQHTAINIRVIGGDGNDSLVNNTRARVIAYDHPAGINFSGKHIAARTSLDPDVNEYDRKSFHYDRLAPLLYGNFNYDDGIFIGGGFHFTNYGFRKNPFKSRHIFLASYAPMTGSYNFRYSGIFNNIFGKVGIESLIDVKAPNFVNNFFGWGNETVFDRSLKENPTLDLRRSVDYYRLRFQEIKVDIKLTAPLGPEARFKIGPYYQRIEIERPVGGAQHFITEYANTLGTGNTFFENPKSFGGITTQWVIDKRDNEMLTTRGMIIREESVFVKGLSNGTQDFSQHEGSVSLYQSFRLPARFTYAVRAGGGLNTGNYEIYQAQILDGKTELRGFRKTRFYGNQKLFLNNDVRVKLANIKTYLFPASFGMNVFYDVGRVWYKNAAGVDPSTISGKSSLWHAGYGGGLWFTPFNFTVLSTEFAHSKDGNMVYMRLGFLF